MQSANGANRKGQKEHIYISQTPETNVEILEFFDLKKCFITVDVLFEFCQSHLTSMCIQADTPEETRRGLEGRTFLRAGEALLLRYPQHSQHGEDGPVGDVMQNTPQESECSSNSIDKLCVSLRISTYILWHDAALYILVCLCNMSKCHPVRFLFAAFNSSLAVNFWWHFALSEAVSRSRGKSLPVLKVLKLQRHSNPFCILLLKQDLDIGWFDSTGKLLEIAPLHKNDSKAKRAVNFHWFPIPCGLVEICRVCRAIQEILCE